MSYLEAWDAYVEECRLMGYNDFSLSVFWGLWMSGCYAEESQ